MPCTAAAFLILLLCPIRQEALPQGLCHIAVPAAPQQSVKSTALVGMSTRSRITPVAECENCSVSIGMSSVKGYGNSLGASSSGANSCHNSSVPVVSSISKHSLTSRRRAGEPPCSTCQGSTNLQQWRSATDWAALARTQSVGSVTYFSLQHRLACTWSTIGPPVQGKLDWIKERVTTVIRGLVHRTYKERLSTGFVQLQGGKAWLAVVDQIDLQQPNGVVKKMEPHFSERHTVKGWRAMNTNGNMGNSNEVLGK